MSGVLPIRGVPRDIALTPQPHVVTAGEMGATQTPRSLMEANPPPLRADTVADPGRNHADRPREHQHQTLQLPRSEDPHTLGHRSLRNYPLTRRDLRRAGCLET